MSLPFNLIYLKYFQDAAKTGSISQSAKENYVSQSAISQGIHRLEEGLGKTLITHEKNRFKLTHEGEIVLDRCRNVFQAIGQLEEAISSKDGEISGRIAFACMHSFALALLPAELQRLHKAHPKLQVNFRLGHTDVIKDWIRRGVVDFGIVLDNEDLSGFQCYEIYRGQYRTYISPACKDPNALSYILSEELMETNILRKAFRKKFHKELPVLMEVSSWEVIAKLTEEGLGIGFFPDYVAANKKALTEYPLKIPAIQYKIFAIFPLSFKPQKNIQAFLKLFNKNSL